MLTEQVSMFLEIEVPDGRSDRSNRTAMLLFINFGLGLF